MEIWNNDQVAAWLASKGFGVWTPYFVVNAIDGRGFACITLEELLDGKIEKNSAKKIIMKRDRQLKKFQNSNYAACYPTAAGSDSDILSPATSSRPSEMLESATSSSTNILTINNSTPNNNNNTLSQSSLLSNSNFLSSSHSPLGTSPVSISPLGTSPETINPLNPYDTSLASEIGEKKRSKGKKMKIGGKYFRKKEKKSSTGSTYNADDDASELSQSDSELSDANETEGVGTPYNVSHHLHVEYHADIGFTGLPPEWRAKFEDEGFSNQSLSPYPLTWTSENVALWLSNLGFGVYTAAFKKEQVDGKRLISFTSAEALRNVFPQITEKHALAMHKQIDILKGSFPKSGKKLLKVFGIPLDTVMQAQRSNLPEVEIPIVLHKLYNFIRERGMKHVGIFRIGPSVAQTQEIRDKIDESMDVTLSDFADCIIPTSLIKLYFRELPHPIITHEVYTSCINALDKEVGEMKRRLESLPLNNYALLKHTLWLLHDISKHKDVNQMGADNLAKVFGPTLLWQNTIGGVDGNALALVQMATRFVETCISSFPALFLSDVPEVIPDDSEETTSGTNADDLEPELAKAVEIAKTILLDDGEEFDENENAKLQTGESRSSSVRSSRLSESTSSGMSMETMILASSCDSNLGTPSSGSFSGFNFAHNSTSSSLSNSTSTSSESLLLDELIVPYPSFKSSYSSDSSSAPSTPTAARDKIFKPPLPKEFHSEGFLTPPVERKRSNSNSHKVHKRGSSVDERSRSNSKESCPATLTSITPPLIERERSQTLPAREHRRGNSVDQESERGRSNSKENSTPILNPIPNSTTSTEPTRDRSNSKENSPQERERSNSKEQAISNTNANPNPNSNSSPRMRVRERSDSKEGNPPFTRERAATMDSIRASPRDRPSPRGPNLGTGASPPFRLSPRELKLRRDTLTVTPREIVASVISPPSPRDPPTPRGTPNKHPDTQPLSARAPLQVLLPPSSLKNTEDNEQNPSQLSKSDSLVPPPHVWPLPSTSSTIPLPPSNPPSSSLPPALPLPPPPHLSLPPPPPPPPATPYTSPRTSEQNLLRRLTAFRPNPPKEKEKEKDKDKDKDKEKEKEKTKQKEIEKDKKREEKELQREEKEETKKLKKSTGSLFMFGKKTKKEDERERSRTIFAVHSPHFPVGQTLKRSASVGVVGEKGEKTEKEREREARLRSLSISGSLID